jgi:hypothetical protein
MEFVCHRYYNSIKNANRQYPRIKKFACGASIDIVLYIGQVAGTEDMPGTERLPPAARLIYL